MGRIAERLRPGPLLILVRKLVVALRPAAALPWLSLQIRLQTDRWFNWYPVAFATGVGVYFFLPREPHMAIFIAAGLLVALFLIRLSASGHRLAMVLAMVFLAGFAGAKLRTSLVAPKVLVASTPTVQIAGKVISMEHYGKKRARFLLRLTSSSEVKPEALPKIVRITGRAPKQMFLSGDSISLKARLFALPTPVQPGGFDFGRKLWFEGVGATGFFYGDVKHLVGKNAASGQGGFFHAATRFIQKIRYDIAARIKAVLAEGIYKWNLSSDQTASVAIALITGDRGGLDKQTSQQLRRAGLAHILAISGLHMSLVAGGMFWLVRALLALFPALAMNYPIKKWAAIAGLFSGGVYLSISGANVATQRAFIMLSIMMLAILVNRRAISMRNVAIAALAILLFKPESVLSAGFQMSFMAVIGLVGFYEIIAAWRAKRTTRPAAQGNVRYWTRKLVFGVLAIAMTTIVASAFTGLPAAFHFNKVSTFALAGNIIAVPLVSFLIMPAAIISVLAMPFGLEAGPLSVMGMGIDLVLAHARLIASFPQAQIPVGDVETFGVLVIVFSLLWACLWKGQLRPVALLPFFIGVFNLQHVQTADVIVSKFARNIAVRGQNGLYVPLDKSKSRFSAENWLLASGDGTKLADAAKRKGWVCQNNVCKAQVSGKSLAFLKRGAKVSEQFCTGLDIIISAQPLRKTCKSVKIRIDRFDLWRQGAHAIYINDKSARVETALRDRGVRPWVIKPQARRKILINPEKHKWKPGNNRNKRKKLKSHKDA